MTFRATAALAAAATAMAVLACIGVAEQRRAHASVLETLRDADGAMHIPLMRDAYTTSHAKHRARTMSIQRG